MGLGLLVAYRRRVPRALLNVGRRALGITTRRAEARGGYRYLACSSSQRRVARRAEKGKAVEQDEYYPLFVTSCHDPNQYMVSIVLAKRQRDMGTTKHHQLVYDLALSLSTSRAARYEAVYWYIGGGSFNGASRIVRVGYVPTTQALRNKATCDLRGSWIEQSIAF